LRIGDEVEIRPGIVGKERDGNFKCTSIFSRIVQLKADANDLLYAVPGGLIGVGMKVDPSLTRSDHLTGHILGHPGKIPDVLIEIDIEFYLMRRLIGVKSDNTGKSSNRV
jgi:translation initiation factor 2 subunit 3